MQRILIPFIAESEKIDRPFFPIQKTPPTPYGEGVWAFRERP